MSATVLIAGGGTGGHVYPMIAVGDALRAEDAATEIVYVGAGRGIEGGVLADRGDRFEQINLEPLRGGGARQLAKGCARMAVALPRARSLVRRLRPDVVFSVGGYAAGPVAFCAWTCGVPVTLLEPNAVPGLTNRMLLPMVSRAYLCFPESAALFGKTPVSVTGVPLRQPFSDMRYRVRRPVRILVIGGSQGAAAFNQVLPGVFGALRAEGLAIDVHHQTGRDKDAAVRACYESLALVDGVKINPFIDDMAAALNEADLVIARAGAGTLAEICAVGRPSILIAYPHAADDHQRHNAESLERSGAAISVLQAEATSARLTHELRRLVDEPEKRRLMAASAKKRSRPDAARIIARDLLQMALATKVPS